MKKHANDPAKKPATNGGPAAGAPGSGPDSEPAGASPADRRQRWIIASMSVATVVMVVAVVLLAKARAGSHADEGGASPGSLPPGFRQDAQHPVGPAADPLPEGCEVQYDHPPKIVLDVPPEGIDFGPIKQGVRAERDLVIRNVGTGTLCLRKPVTGCGCVKAMLVEDQRKIPPGGSAVVKVTLDSTGREGVTTKNLTISSTDPESPTKVIQVRAEVSLGLVVVGLRVDFGTTGKGLPATATVRLRSPKADAPWTVTAVENVPIPGRPEPPALTYEAKEVEDPTWRVLDLTVRHPGHPAYGPVSGQVRIRTSHPDRPEIVMPSWLQVVPSVQALPPNASLGFGPRARIRLVPSQEGVTFRVTGAKVQTIDGSDPGPAGPGFLVEYGPTTQGVHRPGEWWVEIKYDGKSRQPGPLRAEAILTTDAPDASEIKIPISATVPK